MRIYQTFGLAGMIAFGATLSSTAGERYFPLDGYGFAGEALGGAYVGAPFTRFPRASELVPPAWGYGTYGVPTATGISQPPVAAPTLTVINERPDPRLAAEARRRIWDGPARGGRDALEQSAVRVISVTVPRR